MLKILFFVGLSLLPLRAWTQELPSEEPAAPLTEGPAESSLPAVEKNTNSLPEKKVEPSSPDFRDPFAEPAPESLTPSQPVQPEAQPENLPPPPASLQDSTPVENPTEAEPPAPSPQVDAPKPFDFPEPENLKGPVAEDYLASERARSETKAKTWNVNPSFGAGFNLNRRNNQVHFETSGGYRLDEIWEVGGAVYYRFVKDSLLGFVATGKRNFVLRDSRDLRIDCLAGGGLEWAMRKPPSTAKFSEGRMGFRLSSEFLFYPFPRFAITSLVGIESFLFSVTTKGDWTSFFRKGLPTQLLVTVGTRWEF